MAFAGLDLESDLLDNFVGHFSVVMAAEEPTPFTVELDNESLVEDLQRPKNRWKRHQLAQQENFGHIIQPTGTSPYMSK